MTEPEKTDYEALMLDHVYGLLDAQQETLLEAHLAGPEGDRLRQLAEGWKAKLGRVASVSFPDLKFQAPGEKQVAAIAAKAPKRTFAWSRWLIAASLLAATGVMAYPYADYRLERHREAREFAARQDDLTKATTARAEYANRFVETKTALLKEKETAEKAYLAAVETQKQGVQKLEKQLAEREMVIKLTGPEKPMPGAPNEWKITTLDRASQPMIPAMISIVIRNQMDKELFKESLASLENPQGPSTLKLPVSFWSLVKPKDELTLEITAKSKADVAAKLVEKLKLAQPVFITHLATDKPLYQPGEVVHYRSLTLERSTLIPPSEDIALGFKIVQPDGSELPLSAGNGRLVDEKGQPITFNKTEVLRGIGAGEFVIPESASGGEYALVVMKDNVPAEKRKFLVNRYVADKFFKKLEFDGKSYGPGDRVQARATVSRTEGGPLKNAPIQVTASVDGTAIEVAAPKTTDDKGVVNLKFNLPKEIKAGSGNLAIRFQDAADTETIVRPIPVIGRQLDVQFFPEGGDLVAGVPNRVYFQVRTPAGKPADLQGYIAEEGNKVVDLQTLTDTEEAGVSRGQGTFVFTPKLNAKYALKIVRPLNIDEPQDGFRLPQVKPDGVVLTALDDVTTGDAPICVTVQTPKKYRKLIVGAYGRGKLLDHQSVELEANKPLKVELGAGVPLGGVVRITVFEEFEAANGKGDLIPLAERLVFRQAAHNLTVSAKPDKDRYNPGTKVSLNLRSLDDKKQPLPAVLMVAVVNQSVITMADAKTDRLMPTHFLLAGEVKKPEDLEHADFLLGDHPKAAKALDNLLGTQGWRRFAEQNPAQFVRAEKADAERLLVSTGMAEKEAVDPLLFQRRLIEADAEPKKEVALAQLGEVWKEADQFVKNTLASSDYQTLRSRESQAEDSYNKAGWRLGAVKDRTPDMTMPSLIGIGIILAASLLLLLRAFLLGEQTTAVAKLTWLGGMATCIAMVVVMLYFAVTHVGHNANNTFANIATNTSSVSAGGSFSASFAGSVKPESRPSPTASAPVYKDDLDRMLRSKANLMNEDVKFDAELAAATANERNAPTNVDAPTIEFLRPSSGSKLQGDIYFNGLGNKDQPNRNAAALPAGGFGGSGYGGGRGFDRFDAAKAPANLGSSDLKKRIRFNPINEESEKLAMRSRQTDFSNRKMAANPNTLGGIEAIQNGSSNTIAFAEKYRFLSGEYLGLRDDQIITVEDARSHSSPIRVYAHVKMPDAANADLRRDFAETLYWHPALVMPDTGKCDIGFELADDVTRYQVLVAAHTPDGRVAANLSTIEARKPFTVDPKLPTEISSTDRIDVAVRAVNDSDANRELKFSIAARGLAMQPNDLKREGDRWLDSISLSANAKGRKVYSFKPTFADGIASISLDATSAGAPGDRIQRQLSIVPDGFPKSGQVSDLLKQKATPMLALPDSILPGTLKVRLNLYPSTLADLQAGLDGLLREPHGCFEQTSSTNYPNALILDYLSTSDQVNLDVARKAKDLLDKGYKRLISFECPKADGNGREGYEWFGAKASPHEALTAYGLMEFADMARHYPVDPAMMERTRNFLLNQRDGKGSFKKRDRSHSFGNAPDHVIDAYIVWALTESDPLNSTKMDLSKELGNLSERAAQHDDPYFQALVANAFLNRQRTEEAIAILKNLASKQQKPDGVVTGAKTSVCSSGGRDLEIETTSLAMLAFLKAKGSGLFHENIALGMRWLGKQRGGYGGFGSTQATILALKAVIAHTVDQKHLAEGGALSLFVNDKKIAEKIFTAAESDVLTIDVPDPEKAFANGGHKAIRVELDTKRAIPYTLMWECRTVKPASSEACALDLKTSLDKAKASEGDTVQMNVKVANKIDQGHGMAIAILGIPAGMKVPTDLKQLTKLREDGRIAFFEIQGRELVLYWRELAPKAAIDLNIELVCDIPGQYRGPASRAYLYYNADSKAWNEPLSMEIK